MLGLLGQLTLCHVLVGELADGRADGLARVGDIVHVEVDLGVDAEQEGSNGEDDVTRVVNDGGVCVMNVLEEI